MLCGSGNPVIAVDIDGVICDLTEAIKEKLLSQGIIVDETVYPWADEEWFLSNSDVYLAGKPIVTAIRGIEKLSESYVPVFITRRPKEASEQTLEWFMQHGFDRPTVIHTEDKGSAAKELKAVFAIDDSPEDILSYRREKIPVCVVRKPYNRHIRSDIESVW